MSVPRGNGGDRHGQAGYVLLAVTVLTFAMIIGSLAIFTTAGSETRLAHREADATGAFFLADGALERARAHLAVDRNWRDGWRNVALGEGTYSLAITDTTVTGHTNTVKLTATGTVGDVSRRLEMVAELPISSLGLTLLTGQYGIMLHNICYDGKAHHNTWAYYGCRDRYLRCGEYTKGYTINPPPVYTDPAHFPDCTYYDVRVYRVHGNTCRARIFDADGRDITSAVGDSLVGRVFRLRGHNYFVYFNSPTLVRRYFDQESGIFRRAPGDRSVVVNFGGPALERHGHGWREDRHSRTHVYLWNRGGAPVHSTIITTRFIGHRERDRLRPNRWRGGLLALFPCRLEPYNGVAYVAHYVWAWRGTALGSEEWPALGYATSRSYTILNYTAWGTQITLEGHISIGSATMHHSDLLFSRLPSYLVNSWPGYTSGTLRVLSWRELPTTTTGG